MWETKFPKNTDSVGMYMYIVHVHYSQNEWKMSSCPQNITSLLNLNSSPYQLKAEYLVL